MKIDIAEVFRLFCDTLRRWSPRGGIYLLDTEYIPTPSIKMSLHGALNYMSIKYSLAFDRRIVEN
jgi:hypothetical protein